MSPVHINSHHPTRLPSSTYSCFYFTLYTRSFPLSSSSPSHLHPCIIIPYLIHILYLANLSSILTSPAHLPHSPPSYIGVHISTFFCEQTGKEGIKASCTHPGPSILFKLTPTLVLWCSRWPIERELVVSLEWCTVMVVEGVEWGTVMKGVMVVGFVVMRVEGRVGEKNWWQT